MTSVPGKAQVREIIQDVLGSFGMKEPKLANWTDKLTSFVFLLIILLICITGILGVFAVKRQAFPKEIPSEPYRSTQTVSQNLPDKESSYVDLDGWGRLVPMYYETLQASFDFGKKKGEEGKVYAHRVVVMALDPSIRYTDFSGITLDTAYDPEHLYAFYIVDGIDVTDEMAREHTIFVGNKKYRVILLTIDGRNNPFSYTFRVEEVVE